MIENIKEIQIYEDTGNIFFELPDSDSHDCFDPEEHQAGEYSSITISDDIQAIIFIETWYGNCGINDQSGGCIKPDVDWIDMGEAEIVKEDDGSANYCCSSCERMGYRFWDTGIRLPRGHWWSSAL